MQYALTNNYIHEMRLLLDKIVQSSSITRKFWSAFRSGFSELFLKV